MFILRWDQLHITIRDNLPSNTYACAFGNTIAFSKKFIRAIEEGLCSKRSLLFIFLHEMVHIAQQTMLSYKLAKEEINSFIIQNRDLLEKEANKIALHILQSGTLKETIKLFFSKSTKKKINLCNKHTYAVQYWMVNGHLAVFLAGEYNEYSEIEKRKDLLKKIDEDLKNSELIKANSSASNAWVDLQASAKSRGIHESFTIDAFEDLYKNIDESSHKIFGTIQKIQTNRSFNKNEKITKPKKDYVIIRTNKNGEILSEISKIDLIAGSSFNDRIFYSNPKFGLEYAFHTDGFLQASHNGSMQFMHSMDCSNGNKVKNLNKIIKWAEFCLDVYNNVKINEKNIQDLQLKEYIESLDNNDLMKEMIYDIMENVNFYKYTFIKDFFGDYIGYNPGIIALGSICHMLQDSFASSHTKRCFNPFLIDDDSAIDTDGTNDTESLSKLNSYKNTITPNEQEKFREVLKNRAMPIILFADYSYQNGDSFGGKHSHADIFIRELNANDDNFTNFYDKTLNASMGRDCTKALIYMALMGYDKTDICNFIRSLYPLSSNNILKTRCGFQYYKEPDVSLNYGYLHYDWELYGNCLEKLLCYNIKESLASRIEVLFFVIKNLKHLISAAIWKLPEKELSSFLENGIILHYNEILLEIDEITILMESFFEKKGNTEKVNKICKGNVASLINLVKQIESLPNIKFEKKVYSNYRTYSFLKDFSAMDGYKSLLEGIKGRLKAIAHGKYLDYEKHIPQHSHFIVDIYTSKDTFAGTDGGITLSINGYILKKKNTKDGKEIYERVYCEIARQQLINPYTAEYNPDNFERGDLNSFQIKSTKECQVDSIDEIELIQKAVTNFDDWLVEKIIITDLHSEKKWYFGGNQWICENGKVKIHSQEKLSYFKIDVYTSDILGAGTDGDVEISIKGKSNTIPFKKLDNSKNNFERGDKDSFEINTKSSIGEINQIIVKQNGSKWHLDKIVITDIITENAWVFLANKEIKKNVPEPFSPLEKGSSYVFDIFTGDKNLSGTDADVYVSIENSSGKIKTKYQKLNNSKNNFETGKKDTFIISTEYSIDDISRIYVKYNGAGSQWHLDKIIATNIKTGKISVFAPNCWIPKNKDYPLSPQKEYSCFTLNIYTSNRPDAGTDANVKISLFGTGDKKIGSTLLNNSHNNFEKGDIDTFTISSPQSIGPLSKIEISHDGSGAGPDWHLNKILISDVISGKHWSFMADRWVKKEDGIITLKPSSANM